MKCENLKTFKTHGYCVTLSKCTNSVSTFYLLTEVELKNYSEPVPTSSVISSFDDADTAFCACVLSK